MAGPVSTKVQTLSHPLLRPLPRSGGGSTPIWERTSVHLAVIFAWAVFLFGLGLDRGDLYRNETLRAYLTKEAMASGNFVVPHLYGEPLLTKPPGMYLFIGLCSLPFGAVTTSSARLPSALFALAAVVAVYFWLRRSVPAWQAWLMAMLLPCFPLWLAKTPSAEIEMVLVAWVMFAIIAVDLMLEAWSNQTAQGPATAASWWPALIFALCLSAGVLTKWSAPLYVYAALLPLLVWRRQLRFLVSPPHLLALAVTGVLCGVWVVAAIGQIGWTEFTMQLWIEAAPRLLASEHLQAHPDKNLLVETLTHPAKILACVAPLGLLAPLTCSSHFYRRLDPRRRRCSQLLHCWAWPNLLLFTLLPEHASRHSLPFCPALVLLGALWLFSYRPARGSGGVLRGIAARPWQLASFVLLSWLVVKLAYVEVVVPARDRPRQPAAKAHLLAAAIPAGGQLYLGQLKDEGLMFYLDRNVRRVRGWEHLPADARFVVLTELEWREWQLAPPRPHRSEHRLKDSQNDTIVLVELEPMRCLPISPISSRPSPASTPLANLPTG